MAAAAGLPPSIDFAINVRNVIGGNTFVACNRGAKKGLLLHEIPKRWMPISKSLESLYAPITLVFSPLIALLSASEHNRRGSQVSKNSATKDGTNERTSERVNACRARKRYVCSRTT